jgi:tRNA U34 5-methylaminomethyl-2-thiouridine-forming methyltransferase MnmC
MKSRFLYLLVALTTLLAPAAHAQFGSGIVYDPTQSAHAIQQLSQGEQELQKWAQELQKWEQHLQKEEQIYTTAYQTMNQVIAAYNLAYQMSRMPQNLEARYKSDFSKWTNISNPSLASSNTSGITSAWLNALDLGNPTRAASAYSGAVIQVQSYPSSSLSAMDSTTQAVVQNQYASSEIGQANVTNLLSTLGTIRSDSQIFEQKLTNLESDTYSTDPSQQTEVGVLAKINSATMLQIHSQQDTNQILAAAAGQQALDAKEKLDERNRLINQAIYFQQNFSNTMQQVTGGITDAIQSISLSPSGR